MIITRHSKALTDITATLRNINNMLILASWSKHFAWRKKLIQVPGVDSQFTENFVWLDFYYERTSVGIKDITASGLKFTIGDVVRVKNMDTVSYYSMQGMPENVDNRKDKRLDRCIDLMLRTTDPVLACNQYSDALRAHYRLYRNLYERIEGIDELTKGILTADEYDAKVKTGEY
jgi:hypothetical protein